MTELGPLYSSSVIESCASVDEYCFLCSSIDDGADGEAASIRTFVAELVRQHKEINHIVTSVDDIYRNEICGETPWSTDSIRRHLLFSTEFVGLFHGVVDQVSSSALSQSVGGQAAFCVRLRERFASVWVERFASVLVGCCVSSRWAVASVSVERFPDPVLVERFPDALPHRPSRAPDRNPTQSCLPGVLCRSSRA